MRAVQVVGCLELGEGLGCVDTVIVRVDVEDGESDHGIQAGGLQGEGAAEAFCGGERVLQLEETEAESESDMSWCSWPEHQNALVAEESIFVVFKLVCNAGLVRGDGTASDGSEDGPKRVLEPGNRNGTCLCQETRDAFWISIQDEIELVVDIVTFGLGQLLALGQNQDT